jgi:GxxExxY protein
MFEEVPAELDRIARIIVDAVFKVHSTLGSGLLEGVYQICLAHELGKRGLRVEREVPIGVEYDGIRFPAAFRMDLLVEGEIVIETKAVERYESVHAAQLLTYLKLSRKRLGFLVNFNVPLIKDGIKRFARGEQ